jgi:hypothetical protein
VLLLEQLRGGPLVLYGQDAVRRDWSLGSMDYVYELRQGGEVTATGHLSFARDLAPGDEVPFGASFATVLEVRPSLGGTTILILELQH